MKNRGFGTASAARKGGRGSWGEDWLVCMLGAMGLLTAFGVGNPWYALSLFACAATQAALYGRTCLHTQQWRAFGLWFGLGLAVVGLLWFWVGAILGISTEVRASALVAFMAALAPTDWIVYDALLTRYTQRRIASRHVLRFQGQAAPVLAKAQVLVLEARGVLVEDKLRAQAVAAPLRPASLLRAEREPSFLLLMLAALFCGQDEDPEKSALLEMGERFGFDLEKLLKQYPRTHFRTTPWPVSTHRDHKSLRVFARGSLEDLLPCCSMIFDGRARPMEEADRKAIADAAAQLRRHAQTVIAFATGEADAPGATLPPLAFVGMVTMVRPLRPQSREFIECLRDLGVTPILASNLHARDTVALAGLMESGQANVNLSDEQKAQVVRKWQAEGYQVMALGISASDLAMMQA
ncbi:MAG TPA: hypothetical protein PKE04_15195, partial [Clostridia bacterium]|nr:hypothetical protein [Clostridia bacterium]